MQGSGELTGNGAVRLLDFAELVWLVPARQVAEVSTNIDVVPELCCDHAGEGLVHDKTSWGDGWEGGLQADLSGDLGWVEIAGLADGFFREELIDPGWVLRAEEDVGPVGPKHGFFAVGNFGRQGFGSHLAKQPLVDSAIEFVFGMNGGTELYDAVVEDRVAALDRSIHGHAVALGM